MQCKHIQAWQLTNLDELLCKFMYSHCKFVELEIELHEGYSTRKMVGFIGHEVILLLKVV